MIKRCIGDMKLVGGDPDNRSYSDANQIRTSQHSGREFTIFLVHFTDLEIILAESNVCVVELVPKSGFRQERSRERSNWIKPNPVHNQADCISHPAEAQKSSRLEPCERREKSHREDSRVHRAVEAIFQVEKSCSLCKVSREPYIDEGDSSGCNQGPGNETPVHLGRRNKLHDK